MENKSKLNTILLVIIIILLVVVLGYFFLNNSKQKVAENNYPQVDQNGVINNSSAVVSSNKLFDFFDTFTIDKDIGTPTIEFMYPEQNLILLSYATSQESVAYAVYDYKNDILYKNIGFGYVGSSSQPVAFVGNDKLLMYNSSGDDLSANIKGSFIVQDFNNKVIKTIMADTTFHEIYPKYGKIIFIDINTKESGRFNLNTETLELSPRTK